MPAVMTTILNTQYNGQGFDSAQAGYKGLQQSMNDTQKASETTGASMDGLFRRIERPVLAMAAISIADQLTGMGDKGQSATMMIERGLHAVGAALMFVNPELGMTVIGATALFAVFEKMSHQKTAEDFQKEADALEKELAAARDLIPILLAKSDLDKQTKERLKDELDVANESADAFKKRFESTEVEVTAIKARIASLSEETMAYQKAQGGQNDVTSATAAYAQQMNVATGNTRDYSAALNEIDMLTEKLGQDQNFLTGSQKAYQDLQDKSGTTAADASVWNKKHELMLQDYVDTMNLDQAKKKLSEDEKLMAGLGAALESTTDAAEAKRLNAEIDDLKKIMDAENGHIAELQANAATEKSILDDMSQAWAGYAQNIGQSLQDGKQTAGQVMQTMMHDQEKILGDSLIKQLSAKAAASMADPLTVGIALAEIAAIGFVESLLGATGGGAPASAATAPAQNTTQQLTMVNVNFQGGNLGDPGAIAVIMKGITKQTVQRGGQTVVTNVTGSSTPPPGSVA